MNKLLLFGLLSIPVIGFSWRTLFSLKSHGFYRFFSWECIIWLLVSNYSWWFVDPFSLKQVFSWIFLIYGTYLVIAGVIMLRKMGKSENSRNDESLYQFERTTELVDTGIYKYIRHPLYSSLVFLTWGIFLKNTTIVLLIVAMLSTIFLYFTARFDEKECIGYFGDKYSVYMKRSKMFIPFIF
jgi:protein-S-isoprenylcysteine O-methyltransferase Ste14